MAQDPQLAGRVDAAIDKALSERRIVGAVVMVARGGERAYARAAGMADREAGRPVQLDTLFRYASLSKAITSAAALALIESGQMALEDPVTKFLPDFRPKLADGTEPAITIRQLLTHTSGLTYDFMEPPESPYHQAGISNGFDRTGVSMADNLARIAAWPLNFPPGSAWNYSVSTDVLGAAMEKAAGLSLPEIVRAKVTGPLGMADTGFAVVDRERLAAAYADASPEPVRMGRTHTVPFLPSALHYAPERAFDPTAFPSGGAGMVGTAPDYLTFLETLRQGGRPILAPETARGLMTNAIGDMPVPVQGPGYGFSLGCGVLLDPSVTLAPTPQTAGTFAWGGVYGASWFVDPVKELSVVMLTNTAIEGMIGAFTADVRNAVYG